MDKQTQKRIAETKKFAEKAVKYREDRAKLIAAGIYRHFQGFYDGKPMIVKNNTVH